MTIIQNVPASLSELENRWGLWRRETLRGREVKVPYSIYGRRASVTNLADWSSFEEAVAALGAADRFDGLGFLFVRGDSLVGIDLDDSLEPDGTAKPWACGIVERFADTYAEISPSGAGLKIWCRGDLRENVPGVQIQGGGSIEMYGFGRYFTVTGLPFRGAPLQIEDHTADVLRMYEWLARPRQSRVWPLRPLTGGRIPIGSQHSVLVSIAGTLRARRVCDQAILACLLAINEHQCERPGPVENIARIVRSTRNWGTR